MLTPASCWPAPAAAGCRCKELNKRKPSPGWVAVFCRGDRKGRPYGNREQMRRDIWFLPYAFIAGFRADRVVRPYNATTPTRAQQQSLGLLLPLRGCPVRPSARCVPKTKHHPLGGVPYCGRRGSNSLPRPWQGRALPDELRPRMVPQARVELATRGFSVRCSTN